PETIGTKDEERYVLHSRADKLHVPGDQIEKPIWLSADKEVNGIFHTGIFNPLLAESRPIQSFFKAVNERTLETTVFTVDSYFCRRSVHVPRNAGSNAVGCEK